MTLRARLFVAAGVCLAVMVASFVAIAQRQEQTLIDQLDTQLTFAAERVSILAAGGATSAPPPSGGSGELFIGGVVNDELVTSVAPASNADLRPDLDDVLRAPRGVPLTIGTTDAAVDMRVIVQDIDDVAVVTGQSTESIDDAIRSLRLSGLVAVAAIGAVAVIVGWWVNRLSIQPIRVATGVADAIAAGRRGERVPESPRNTEAASLGNAMNLMLDTTAETEARLRSFVADASHELRTPLTTLMGYADLHRQGLLSSTEEVDDAMRRIRGEANRMSTIVEHLFLLANLDEGVVPIEPAVVDVGQLLDDVAADARVVQPARSIAVRTDADLEVIADPQRLLQTVSILVTNALTHTPATASLTLVGEAESDEVVIKVIDAGPGIGPEHVGRVFDRFYRADTSRDHRQGGSGLGLAIARSIADAHGGTLDVESVEGEGATFILRMPRQ